MLDETFLLLRSKLLDVGAMLDRLDRCEGNLDQDARLQKLMAALRILNEPTEQADRAKQLQLLFSRTYESKWRSDYQL